MEPVKSRLSFRIFPPASGVIITGLSLVREEYERASNKKTKRILKRSQSMD
jgi:hypothetical protein